jgi:hypothetical protein
MQSAIEKTGSYAIGGFEAMHFGAGAGKLPPA